MEVKHTDLPLGLRRVPLPDLPGALHEFAWTPAGALAISSAAGLFRWTPGSGEWEPLTEEPAGPFSFSADGRWLAYVTGREDLPGTVAIVDLSDGRELHRVALPLDCFRLQVRSAIDERPVLDLAGHQGDAGGQEGPARLWFWKPGDRDPGVVAGDRPSDLWCLSESAATGILATGYANGDILLEGGPLSEPVLLSTPHTEQVRDFSWSRDGRRLISGANDSVIGVWDVDRRSLVEKLEEPSGGGSLSVSLSHDDTLLASASAAGLLGLWRTEDFSPIEFSNEDAHEELFAVRAAFSPAAPLLAVQTSGAEDTLRLLDTGELAGIARRDARPTPSKHDEPSTSDQLGRAPLVNALAAMIAHPDQGTPFTVGLFADWGAGKSSVLEQLKRRLEADHPGRFKFALFNAWEHEHVDNVAAGLAQCVAGALADSLRSRWRFAWRRNRSEFAWTLGLVLLAGLAVGLAPGLLAGTEAVAAITGGGVLAAGYVIWRHVYPLVRELGSHPVTSGLRSYLNLPDYSRHLGLIPALQRDINDLAEIALATAPSGYPRLVVFIDDLDRCSGPTVVATLEAVRLVMDRPGVIAIVALDARIALEAVAGQYAKSDHSRPPADTAREYLGKIIQLPVSLTEPPAERIGEFVRLTLFDRDRARERPGQRRDRPRRRSPQPGAVETTPTATVTREASKPAEPQAAAVHLEHSPEEIEQFQSLSAFFGITNPRRLLRLRNSYRLAHVLEADLGPAAIMNMLFWLEFVYESPDQAGAKLDGEDPHAAWATGVFKDLDRDALEQRVARYVLPRL